MSDIFPQEIWVQILCRLPLKSLVKCTSVCKAWNSLITDHAFISDHLTHTIQANRRYAPFLPQLFTVQEDSPGFDEFYSLNSDNKEIDRLSIFRLPLIRKIRQYGESAVVGTCNGLVCFAVPSVFNRATQIIWNPSIRKYVVLPKPSMKSKQHYMDDRHQLVHGFGFDSRNKDFKLVSMVTRRWEEATPQVEIYSLASGHWRRVAATAPPLLLDISFWDLEKTPHMFVNGVLHWVVNRRSNGEIHNFIYTFDVSEETFGELKLPQCLKESRFRVSILGGGNSLAVYHRKDPGYEDTFSSIWVMKEYGEVESWTQVFHSNSTQYGGIWSILALRSSGEVVAKLKTPTNGIVLLDPMTGLVKKLELRLTFREFVGSHTQSLFLINKVPHVLSY